MVSYQGQTEIHPLCRHVSPHRLLKAYKSSSTHISVDILPVIFTSKMVAIRAALQAVARPWLLAVPDRVLVVVRPRPHPSTLGAEVLEVFQARIEVRILLATPGATARSGLRTRLDRVVHVITLRPGLAALEAEMLSIDQLAIFNVIQSMVTTRLGPGLMFCIWRSREKWLKASIRMLLIAEER